MLTRNLHMSNRACDFVSCWAGVEYAVLRRAMRYNCHCLKDEITKYLRSGLGMCQAGEAR